MIKTVSLKSTDNVIVGTGHKTKAAMVGNIRSNVCSHYGANIYCNVALTDVAVLPNSKFNLISSPVMLNKGWKLSGNEKCIELCENNVVIRFDIKILTNRGALYCAIFRRHNVS